MLWSIPITQFWGRTISHLLLGSVGVLDDELEDLLDRDLGELLSARLSPFGTVSLVVQTHLKFVGSGAFAVGTSFGAFSTGGECRDLTVHLGHHSLNTLFLRFVSNFEQFGCRHVFNRNCSIADGAYGRSAACLALECFEHLTGARRFGSRLH